MKSQNNSAPVFKEQQFASDNYAGICPEAMAAMIAANNGSASAYGHDVWTDKAAQAFRDLFATDCEMFFVFNGTASNSLALAAVCQSYHSVICSQYAHVFTDECGAPEFFSNGSKLMTVNNGKAKITPDEIIAIASSRSDIHFPKPSVVTITQPTETGEIYTIAEIKAISKTCKELGLKLHMDGARFANACATLNCSPADISYLAGVDVLGFGCTKNGMAVGDVVLFFDKELAREFDYRCKQAGQLASKMRFLSAPLVGMIESGAWLSNAKHGNECAKLLEKQIKDLPGIEIAFPVQANSVFVQASDEILDKLRAKGWHFYTFIGGSARFMFAWDADIARVNALAQDLTEICRVKNNNKTFDRVNASA